MIRSGFRKGNVKFKKPFTDKKLPLEEKYKVLNQGVLITSINDVAVDAFIPEEIKIYILDQQDNADVFMQEKSKPNESESGRYEPKYLADTEYEVNWNIDTPKKIIGTNDERKMVQSLDVGFKTPGSEDYDVIAGNAIHKKLFAKSGTLHGNMLSASFSLSYKGKNIEQTSGTKAKFGSGKTKDSSEKSENTDQIATMLVDSGQISSVKEYNDERHSHSEQSMIVHLSQNLNVFDQELAKIEKKAAVVALVVDIYSDPNTVCDHCHPSLETFLAKTDWKDKVIQHLKEQLEENSQITIVNPPVLLRVSSNKSFGAGASKALKSVKEDIKLNAEEAEIFFIEGKPFGQFY